MNNEIKKRENARDIFATNVTYLRHKNKISQEELSEKTGISVSLISDIENSRANIGIDYISTIASVFKMSISEITHNYGHKITKKRYDEKKKDKI